jgi:hypothetical protein
MIKVFLHLTCNSTGYLPECIIGDLKKLTANSFTGWQPFDRVIAVIDLILPQTYTPHWYRWPDLQTLSLVDQVLTLSTNKFSVPSSLQMGNCMRLLKNSMANVQTLSGPLPMFYKRWPWEMRCNFADYCREWKFPAICSPCDFESVPCAIQTAWFCCEWIEISPWSLLFVSWWPDMIKMGESLQCKWHWLTVLVI